MQWNGTRRRGGILAAALVCLLIVMLFAGTIARSMVMRQHALRLNERQVQCFWLAESASWRAVAKCRLDPAYKGEAWRIPFKDGDLAVEGVAEIHVEEVAGFAHQRRIRITARWPDEPIERSVRQKEFTIQLPSAPGAAS